MFEIYQLGIIRPDYYRWVKEENFIWRLLYKMFIRKMVKFSFLIYYYFLSIVYDFNW